MEHAMAEDQEESVTVKAPGGVSVTARGDRTATAVLVAVIGVALIYLVFMHHQSTEAALKKIEESLNNNTYVLSLSQERREKLGLDMPESLRIKTRRQREDP